MPNSSSIVFFNGKYLPEESAGVSTLDRGLLYGDGLFETLLCVNDAVVSFRDHIDRMQSGCSIAAIHLPYTGLEIREIIRDLLKKNKLSDAVVRITVTRGVTETFGFGYSKALKPTFIIHTRPSIKVPSELYEKGVRTEVQKINMLHSQGHGLALKSLSAQEYVLAKQAALEQQCYEMILMDHFDNVLEGTSSNVFIVKDGMVITPPLSSGILKGITRKRVIEILDKKLKQAYLEKIFSKSELILADEIFLTNTNVQVLPVTRVGNKTISQGKIGAMTSQILDTFRQTLIEILE